VISAPMLRTCFPGFGAFVNTPWRSDSLLSGALLAVLVRWEPFLAALKNRRSLLLVLFFMIFTGSLYLATKTSTFGALNIFWLAAAYAMFVLLAFVTTETFFGRLLRVTPLVWCGKHSFGIYLLHQMVSGFVHGFLRHAPPAIGSFSDAGVTLLALFITFILAALSFRYFEGPILRMSHGFKYEQKQQR